MARKTRRLVVRQGLRNWRRGDDLRDARHHNQEHQILQPAAGVDPASPEQGEFPRNYHHEVRRFEINGISNATLTGKMWDGTTLGANNVEIQRNYLTAALVTAWNGITYVYTNPQLRVATLGVDTEDQVVVPAYVAGDEIWAIRLPRGGTGGIVGVDWLDLNLDARAWAKQNDE